MPFDFMDRQTMHHAIEQVEHDLATLRAVFEAVQQGVFVIDARDQQIVDANPAATAAMPRRNPRNIFAKPLLMLFFAIRSLS